MEDKRKRRVVVNKGQSVTNMVNNNIINVKSEIKKKLFDDYANKNKKTTEKVDNAGFTVNQKINTDEKDNDFDVTLHRNQPLHKQIAYYLFKSKLTIVVKNEETLKNELYFFNKTHFELDFDAHHLKKIINDLIEGIFQVDQKMIKFIDLMQWVFRPTVDDQKKYVNNVNYVKQLINATINDVILMHEKIYDLHELNPDEHLICAKNGIVNLKTGELLPHHPQYKITKIVDANYIADYVHEKNKPELYLKMLSDAIYDDQKTDEQNNEILEALLLIKGYSIIKGNPEKILPIICGPTGCGKSVDVAVLIDIFGDYAKTANSVSFMRKSNYSAGLRPDLVKIAHSRMVFAVEADDKQIFDTQLLKSLSGNDEMSFRKLMRNTVSFKFPGIISLYTNVIPKLSKVDDLAFLKRLLIIHYKNSVAESKIDKKLTQKLTTPENKDKIFSMLVQYAKQYYSYGTLNIPHEFNVNKERLILERSDLVKKFFEEKCELRPEKELPLVQYKWGSSHIYMLFHEWCKNELQIDEIPTLQAFTRRFKEITDHFNGINRQKINNGRIYYTGFNIIDAPLDPSYYLYQTSKNIENKGKKSSDSNIEEYMMYKMFKNFFK